MRIVADVAEIRALAGTHGEAAEDLWRITTDLHQRIEDIGVLSVPLRALGVGSLEELMALAELFSDAKIDLHRRAAEVEAAQGGGPRASLWGFVDPNTDFGGVNAEPPSAQAVEGAYGELLEQGTPAQVRAYWNTLSTAMRLALVSAHPAEIAYLEGVPLNEIYAMNQERINLSIDELNDQIRREIHREGLAGSALTLGGPAAARIRELERRRANLRAMQGDTYAPRQYLVFEEEGDGRVIEVFGDLRGARNVGVYVPGADSDLDGYSTGTGASAGALWREAEARNPGDTAVIGYLYDAPTLVPQSISKQKAEAAAPALARFVNHIEAQQVDDTDVRSVVIGHSYGTVVAGLAIRDEGMRPDAFVVQGSPGPGADHVSEYHAPQTEFYALSNEDDPVSERPYIRSRHGMHTSDPNSGFVRLDAEHEGHTYMTEGSDSLRNTARVLDGDLDSLTYAEPSGRAPGGSGSGGSGW